MFKWWNWEADRIDKMAGAIQQSQLAHDRVPDMTYTDEQVRQAIMFTRSDLVLVFVHLAGLNRQISSLVNIAWLLLLVLFEIAWHLWR